MGNLERENEEELKMTASSEKRLGSGTGSFALTHVRKSPERKCGNEYGIQPLLAASLLPALSSAVRERWDTAQQKYKLFNLKDV